MLAVLTYIKLEIRLVIEGHRPVTGSKEEKLNHRLESLKMALKDFFFGATAFEIQQTVRQEKLARHDLILLFSFGDLLGVPVFPPYYSLRLLPYYYRALDSWKKRVLKEKDLSEIPSL